MKGILKFALLSAPLVLAFASSSCKNGSEPEDEYAKLCPTPPESLTIVEPAFEDTFSVGDQVTIKWCVPSGFQGNIRVLGSPDLGLTEKDLPGKAIPRGTFSYQYTIPEEWRGRECTFQVKNYIVNEEKSQPVLIIVRP